MVKQSGQTTNAPNQVVKKMVRGSPAGRDVPPPPLVAQVGQVVKQSGQTKWAKAKWSNKVVKQSHAAQDAPPPLAAQVGLTKSPTKVVKQSGQNPNKVVKQMVKQSGQTKWSNNKRAQSSGQKMVQESPAGLDAPPPLRSVKWSNKVVKQMVKQSGQTKIPAAQDAPPPRSWRRSVTAWSRQSGQKIDHLWSKNWSNELVNRRVTVGP